MMVTKTRRGRETDTRVRPFDLRRFVYRGQLPSVISNLIEKRTE